MKANDKLSRTAPTLWYVIPCYNEEEVLPVTAPTFLSQLQQLIDTGKVSAESKVCFVDDGSSDSTWEFIAGLADVDPRVVGLALSRNFGHQGAVLAGLMEARNVCDITISIDCDGQDDITASEKMVDAYLAGDDVVYGVRASRDTDTAFKRMSAQAFYKVMSKMGAEVVFNHADYRLMSSRALDGLAEFGEANLYLRGIVPMVGYPHSTVEYDRDVRLAGESHYPFRKMAHLALDGITSFSVKPIRAIMGIGVAFCIIGCLVAIWALISFVTGQVVAGWTSLIWLMCFIGGLQLVSLGIIGEYIGKIYLETKARPRFIIKERTWVEGRERPGSVSGVGGLDAAHSEAPFDGSTESNGGARE